MRAVHRTILCVVALAFVPGVSGWIKDMLPDLAKFEIMLNHFQSLSLIGDLDVTFPLEFDMQLSLVDSFALDTESLGEIGMPTLGIRWMFTLYACIFPLFMTFLMLLFFNSGTVVVWYFLFLSALACTGAAVTLFLLPRESDKYHGNHPFPVMEMLFAGVGLWLLTICLYLIQWQVAKGSMALKIRGQGKKQVLHEYDDRYKRRWSLLQTLKSIVMVGLLVFIALNLAQSVNPLGLSFPAKGTQPAAYMTIGGVLLLAAGSLVFLRLLCSCCEKGRWLLNKLYGLWVKYFILIVLVALSAVYIPILVVMLEVWACEDVTCPLGSRFPPKLSLIEQIHQTTSELDFASTCTQQCCDLCSWNGTCPEPLSVKLCPEVTDARVHIDHSLSCAEHITPYFLPASLLMWFSFTIGVPYLYWTLIHQHTVMLDKVKTQGDDAEERWGRNMALSENSGKSLYEIYQKKWRYYKLMQLFQKLFLAIVTILAWNLPAFGGYLTAGIHCSFFLASLIFQPYIALSSNMMATMAIFADFITTTMALLLIYDADLPAWAWIIITVLNIAAPVCLGLAGALYYLQQRGIQAEGEEKREAMLQLREEKEKKKEEEGKIEAKTIDASVPLSKKTKPGGRDRVMQRRNDRKEGGGGQTKKVHPIFLKTSQNRRKDVEVMLMDEGADPNTQDNFENTPLHYACLEGHKAIVKTLMRYGADLNIPNKAGNTPLHVAFAFKREAIQEYLIEKGADVTARNSFNADPYEVEGEFLAEYRSDMREDRGGAPPDMPKKKEPRIPSKSPAKKATPKNQREEEEIRQKQDEMEAAAAEAAEEAEQEVKEDLHGRIALQRKLETDDKLMHWGKQATMEDPEIRATVDRKVDEATVKTMSRFFLYIGACSFIALGCCLVGLCYGNQDLVLFTPTQDGLSQSESVMFEFLDWQDWNSFSSHCCCMERPGDKNRTAAHMTEGDVVELWLCDNGMRKERLRIGTIEDSSGNRVVANGTALRPFCGRTWAPGYCQPIWQPRHQHFVTEVCSPSTAATNPGGTESIDVLKHLW